jgi:hypothetical protein
MRSRCLNPNNGSYKHYGALGVSVCERWQGPDGFANFIADMGQRPRGRTLDRINPFLGYCPENCRWATPKEQANNFRRQFAASHPDDPAVIAGLKIETEQAEESFHGNNGAFAPAGF